MANEKAIEKKPSTFDDNFQEHFTRVVILSLHLSPDKSFIFRFRCIQEAKRVLG